MSNQKLSDSVITQEAIDAFLRPGPFLDFFELKKRTLVERLFTLPWRPFKKTKFVLCPDVGTVKIQIGGKLLRSYPIHPVGE